MPENQILDELVYEPISGSLLYKDVRYLLIRPETLAGFQKNLVERCGQEGSAALFEGGYAGGSLSARKYQKIHNFCDQEIVKFMMNMGNQIGWGNFRLVSYDAALNHLCVAVHDSPFAQAYGPSSQGVCHLIRGVLAGMAEVLFDRTCNAAEVQCRAMGDEACRFEIEAGKDKAGSGKLKAQSSKLKGESSKLKARSLKLKAQSSKLKGESSKLKAQS